MPSSKEQKALFKQLEKEAIDREYEEFRQLMSSHNIPSIDFFSREDLDQLDLREIATMEEDEVISLLQLFIKNSSVNYDDKQIVIIYRIFALFFGHLCLFYEKKIV